MILTEFRKKGLIKPQIRFRHQKQHRVIIIIIKSAIRIRI